MKDSRFVGNGRYQTVLLVFARAAGINPQSLLTYFTKYRLVTLLNFKVLKAIKFLIYNLWESLSG